MPLDETRTAGETGHLADHNDLHAFRNDFSTVAPSAGQMLVWNATAGQWEPGSGASSVVTVEDNATTAYTVVAADAGKVKRFTAAGAVTVTLPTGLAVGTIVNLLSWGAGGLSTAAGTGATVQGGGTVTQYKEASALVVAADTWSVQGAA